MPRGTSTTSVRSAWFTWNRRVTSVRPAVSPSPRASSASRASVSTFCTSVGRPSTPHSRIGTSFDRGSGPPPPPARGAHPLLPPRHRLAARQGGDQSGLLAGEEPVGGPVQPHRG